MRTPRELAFRLKQEIANALSEAHPTGPELRQPHTRPWICPLRDDAVAYAQRARFGAEIIRKADELLLHRFEFLGERFDAGTEIAWRRDYRNEITSAPRYFCFIPYLDASKVGDHKFIWELNRHQHLVLLAQAQLISGDRRYLVEIERQLDSWTAAEPVHARHQLVQRARGRLQGALVDLGSTISSAISLERGRPASGLVDEIYRSGLYLEHNLS